MLTSEVKHMKSAILASILAATAVIAQPTGDWMGRAGMMDGYTGGSTFHMILGTLFFVGLVLLVWLWVFKLWKEVRRSK